MIKKNACSTTLHLIADILLKPFVLIYVKSISLPYTMFLIHIIY
jgi:hypothetical protein